MAARHHLKPKTSSPLPPLPQVGLAARRRQTSSLINQRPSYPRSRPTASRQPQSQLPAAISTARNRIFNGPNLSLLSPTLSAQIPLSTSPSLHLAHAMSSASSIPTTQKGVRISATGGPEVLEYRTDLPVPTPAEGEVLVKNNLSGVNYIDTYFRTGLYPSPKPEVLGREGAGTIVALGPGPNPQGFAVGDRVAWLNTAGYAEYSVAPAKTVAKIPDGVADEDVLASFLSGLTVLSLVREAYPVQKGDWILLHAAAGGAGFLMTQLLKLAGAKVIGTAGGPEKVELVKSLGADVVIDYKSPEGANWLDKVMEVTNGEGVAAVFDSVGKDTWDNSLNAVKRKGSAIFFGNASGPVPPFPIQRLSPKNIRVMRTMLFAYIETREEFDYYTSELFQLLKSGQLKTKIHKVYPLEQITQAHIDLEGRKTTGKLLLKP